MSEGRSAHLQDEHKDRIVRLVNRHTLAVQAWLASRSPQGTCFEGLGTTVSSTGLQVTLLNQALGSHYPPGTPGQEIDAEVERVKAFFAERDVPWYWWLGPDTQPVDMPARLERHGLALEPPPLPAMVAELRGQGAAPGEGIRVWKAATAADLQAASTIRRRAFQFRLGAALDYFEAMADDWLRGDPARLYLASLGDGQPAAIGALIMGAGLPGVYVMATLPEKARQGLGKAILTRILGQAREEGHRIIALTASDIGFGLYRQFDFQHVFDYLLYRLA